MSHYRLPAEETRAEISVVNSRFIATISPVFSIDEAKGFIRRIKLEFEDASHNVPAFVIGHGASVIAHCNDDGEPSGTAGRPVLAVLQGSGLGDTAVVVTRYFGGTKLGKGGLVRSYQDAVREVLKDLPLAKKILTHQAIITIPYALYEQINLLIRGHKGKIEGEDFSTDVTITFWTPVENFSELDKAICELTHGKIQAHVIVSDETTIVRIAQSI